MCRRLGSEGFRGVNLLGGREHSPILKYFYLRFLALPTPCVFFWGGKGVNVFYRYILSSVFAEKQLLTVSLLLIMDVGGS